MRFEYGYAVTGALEHGGEAKHDGASTRRADRCIGFIGGDWHGCVGKSRQVGEVVEVVVVWDRERFIEDIWEVPRW